MRKFIPTTVKDLRKWLADPTLGDDYEVLIQSMDFSLLGHCEELVWTEDEPRSNLLIRFTPAGTPREEDKR